MAVRTNTISIMRENMWFGRERERQECERMSGRPSRFCIIRRTKHSSRLVWHVLVFLAKHRLNGFKNKQYLQQHRFKDFVSS